jgi:hypothetical protein
MIKHRFKKEILLNLKRNQPQATKVVVVCIEALNLIEDTLL